MPEALVICIASFVILGGALVVYLALDVAGDAMQGFQDFDGDDRPGPR